MAAGGGGAVRVAREAAFGEDDVEGGERGPLGVGARHLDDGDAVVRGLAVRVGRPRGVRGDVDVDAAALGHQGVGVRTAGRLHGGHVLGVAHVADVEDADALPCLLLGRRQGAAPAGVVAARGVDGQDEQVPGDGDIALAARAEDLGDDLGRGGAADVVDDETVVVPREGVVALEGEVGVEPGERGRVRDAGNGGDVGAVGYLVHPGDGAALDGGQGVGAFGPRDVPGARLAVARVGRGQRRAGQAGGGQQSGCERERAEPPAPCGWAVQRCHRVLRRIRLRPCDVARCKAPSVSTLTCAYQSK